MKKLKHIPFLFMIFISRYLVDSKLTENDSFLEELYLNSINNSKFLGKINKIEEISNNNFNFNFTNFQSTNSNWFNIKNIGYFTYIHLILSFLIIPILSIILIFIDASGDKSIKANLSLPSNMKVKIEYNLFKNTFLIKAKYLFSWFLFKYHYPITNIIFIYHYNHPRYIRLILFVIEILFNTLIVALIVLSSIKNDIFDDKIAWKGVYFICLSVSLIVCLIMNLILKFTYRLIFEFHYIRREIFKSKFEILRKYIYYVIKKDVLFNSKWNSIRNRMFTYYRICGSVFLKQGERNKYQRYVNNKLNNSIPKYNNINTSLNNRSYNSSFCTVNLNKTQALRESNDLYINKVNTINTIDLNNENLNEPKNSSNYPKTGRNTLINNYDEKDKIKGKEIKGKYKIKKGVESFSFSKFGINNMKLKTVKRIEDIRNRYMTKKKDVKFDETLEIENDIKIFENLDIESLEGFTYISTNSMIDKLNNIKINSDKLIINIITGIVLVFIMLLINFCLMILQMDDVKNIEKINFLLFIIIIDILFVNFIIHRAICIFIAFTLPNFYGKKKRNCCYKLIFDIFYEKYIRYLYRIRLLISKYKKELNFIEK